MIWFSILRIILIFLAKTAWWEGEFWWAYAKRHVCWWIRLNQPFIFILAHFGLFCTKREFWCGARAVIVRCFAAAANNDDELDMPTHVSWKYWIITRLVIVRNSQCQLAWSWCLFGVVGVRADAFGVYRSCVKQTRPILQCVCGRHSDMAHCVFPVKRVRCNSSSPP